MPGQTPRTRVIFQNNNIFVGPAALSGNTATGQMYFSGNSGPNLIAQLANVQSASITVGINRQDINIFGILERQAQILIAPPTITMDFSYNVTDGYNEQMLGFNTNGASFISGILTKVSDSKNYFLSLSPQGIDDDGFTNQNQRDQWALGNGFVSNYTFNAAVGQVATANVTVDALNVATYTGSSGNATPAVDPTTSIPISAWTYQLPVGQVISGANNIFALRPGDIQLSFPTAAGFLVPLSGQNSVKVQSVSISIPISREVLNALGTPFGYSREIQFPLNATMNIRALQTDLQPNSFSNLFCSDPFYNFAITCRQPSCNGTGLVAVQYKFNNAKVSNMNFGYTIGGDATVDINTTAQLAGANSQNGITFSGSY